MKTVTQGIGTFQEYSLHADLKEIYKDSDGKTEVQIDRFIIDVVNGEQLIEIQTKNFSQIRDKLLFLLQLNYIVKLVHPIYEQKIFRTRNGEKETLRTSPIKENLLAIFNELIYIPELFSYPNFTFEVVFTKIEIVRKRLRRNKFKNENKKLLETTRTVEFSKAEDFLFIIPYTLQKRLSTSNLKEFLHIKYSLASRIIYFFSKTGLLRIIDKERNLKIYSVKIDKLKV